MDVQITAAAATALENRPSSLREDRAEAAVRNAVAGGGDAALRDVAQKFETAFLAEMLKHANLGEMDTAFGGGYGEDAFRSFLIDEYAASLSASSNIGLAEKVYADLKNKVAAYE